MNVVTSEGLEPFMESAKNGWSFLAAKASHERFVRAIERRTTVLRHRRRVEPRLQLFAGERLEQPNHSTARHAFLVHVNESPWTILLRTVDWISPADALATKRLAAELSHDLAATTAASIGVYGGAECRVFRHGQEIERYDTDEAFHAFHDFCVEQGLTLPGLQIGREGREAALYVERGALGEFTRVDYLRLAGPT